MIMPTSTIRISLCLILLSMVYLTKSQNVTEKVVNSTIDCIPEEDLASCTKKPKCCYVSTYYYTFTEKKCVDVLSNDNAKLFCTNLFARAKSVRHGVETCQCLDIAYNGSSYHYLGFMFLLMFLI